MLMLSERYRQKRFKAKDVLYHQGDQVDVVYLIQGGMVKLLNYSPSGQARIVRLNANGHYIGLEGLVGHAYEHTAVAVNDAEVFAIPMQSLRLREKDEPLKYLEVLKNGYTQVFQADYWIANFSTGSIKPRVARLVDFLSNLEYGEASDLVQLLTVHEMAEMLGVTPESVSRVLATFKRSNILHKQDSLTKELYQVDRKRLQMEAMQ